MARKPVRRKAVRKTVRKPKPRPKPTPPVEPPVINPRRMYQAVEALRVLQYSRIQAVSEAVRQRGGGIGSFPSPSFCLRRAHAKLETLTNVVLHCQPAFADTQSLALYRHSLRVLLADAANYCAFLASQLDRITEVLPDAALISPRPASLNHPEGCGLRSTKR